MAIFQRSVRTPEFEDGKDHDENLSMDDWNDIFQSDEADIQSTNMDPTHLYHKVPLSQIQQKSASRAPPSFINVSAMLSEFDGTRQSQPTRVHQRSIQVQPPDGLTVGLTTMLNELESGSQSSSNQSGFAAMLSELQSDSQSQPSQGGIASMFSQLQSDTIMSSGQYGSNPANNVQSNPATESSQSLAGVFSSGFLNMIEQEIKSGPSGEISSGGMSLDFGDMDLEDIVQSMNTPYEYTEVQEHAGPIEFSDGFIEKVESALEKRTNDVHDITSECDASTIAMLESKMSQLGEESITIETDRVPPKVARNAWEEVHPLHITVGGAPPGGAWMDADSTDSINDSSTSTSTTPRSEKRKEFPELSPTQPDSDDAMAEQQRYTILCSIEI